MRKGCRLILLLCLFSCDRSDNVVVPPVVSVKVSPASGKTTNVFTFDLSKSESNSSRGDRLFTRWDWNGDGIWDTPLTRLEKYEHRYFVPGTWHTLVEMVNLDGGSDTASMVMQVERGYSHPNVSLTIKPVLGHIFTSFLLDASGTRDDEDSLNQLKFRWDFEGDGTWDTGLTDSLRIHHVYPEVGFYKPRVEVGDPSGMYSGAITALNVNLNDPRLLASFRCIPDSVTYRTLIQMDASASVDLDNPEKRLLYRWDWNNDWNWDTEWLRDPVTLNSFPADVFAFVRLQVKSYRGLTNDTVMKIRLYHKNQPPRANFKVSTFTGNTKTNFRFDCWWCRDQESSPTEMLYRWDYDGDGVWDTEPVHDVITYHQYANPGVYKATLLLTDPPGDTDTCSITIHISNGTNLTGICEDSHGLNYEYYGTVLIGDQWWFSKNVCFGDTALWYRYPVTNNWPAYFEYGHLYSLGGTGNCCPPGWRVPTRQDWEKLFANYPEEKLYEALMPGGESDFGATLGGKGNGMTALSAVYSGKDKYGDYWSVSHPTATTLTHWMVSFDSKNERVTWGFNASGNLLQALRCVKED